MKPQNMEPLWFDLDKANQRLERQLKLILIFITIIGTLTMLFLAGVLYLTWPLLTQCK